MRFLSCHRQSFQSASGTSPQKPRPAEWNCFKEWKRAESGSSVSVCPSSMLLCILRHYKSDRKGVKAEGSNGPGPEGLELCLSKWAGGCILRANIIVPIELTNATQASDPAPDPGWGAAKRVGFRFVFSLFALCLFTRLLLAHA